MESKLMEHRVGDLLEQTDLDFICHGVNCRGVMSAGIARQIADRFPELRDEYMGYCDFLGEKALGTATFHTIVGKYDVVNLYTQLNPGPDARYDAIRSSLQHLFGILNVPPSDSKVYKIGFCQIGCGIGGLEWEAVKEIIIASNPLNKHHLVEVEYG